MKRTTVKVRRRKGRKERKEDSTPEDRIEGRKKEC